MEVIFKTNEQIFKDIVKVLLNSKDNKEKQTFIKKNIIEIVKQA